MPHSARRAAAVALGALALAGCGAPSSTVPGAAPAGASTTAVLAGSSLPSHALTLGGQTFDAASVRGHPVMLWFWAPWCAVCRGEAPTVAKLAASYPDVRVIGVAGQGSRTEMQSFVAQTGTGTLTHLVDSDGAIWRRYHVVAQPAFAFIEADAHTDLRVGALDEPTLRRLLQALSDGAPAPAGTATTGPSCTSGGHGHPMASPGSTGGRGPTTGSLACGSAGPPHTGSGPSGTTTTTR